VSAPSRDELQAAVDCAVYLLSTTDIDDMAVDDLAPEVRVALAMGLLFPYSTVGQK
jgi:hypothetical protein